MRTRLFLLVLIPILTIAAPVIAQDSISATVIPVNSQLHGFAVSPDGGTVAVYEIGLVHDDLVLDEYLPIRLYDAQTGEVVAEITGHSDYAVSLAFSPDGSRLVSLHFSGVMHVWDAETGEEIRRIDGTPGGVRLKFMPDGASVVVLNNLSFQNHFVIWDIESGTATRVLAQYPETRAEFIAMQDAQPVPDSVVAFDVAPDGASILLAFSTGKIVRWDVASGEETVLQPPLDDIPRLNIRHIEYDGTGERVVFSHREEGTLTVMDAQSGAVIDTIAGVTPHFAVEGEAVAWLVQGENDNTSLNVADLADLTDVQSYGLGPMDMARAPGTFAPHLQLAGGHALIGGLPNLDLPRANAIFVLTP